MGWERLKYMSGRPAAETNVTDCFCLVAQTRLKIQKRKKVHAKNKEKADVFQKLLPKGH